ncbi:unnamed protein product [Rhizophagus irregularis]|nr:unnamed protein product [Rhizophagus irregularis]
MDEKVDNRFHETLHGTRNCNSVWSNRQNGGLTLHSPDINHNSLERNLSIMVVLCDKSTSKFQEIKLPSPENISSQKTGFPIQQDDFDGIEYRGQDTYMARTERNGEDYIPKQQIGSGIENENSQSIKRVPFGCCPNTERVRIMQASLGKLCRDYGLDSTPWTQIPKKSCKLVLPDDINGDSDDQTSMSQMQMDSKDDEMLEVLTDPKNSLILVEMIACESDICRVSSSIAIAWKAAGEFVFEIKTREDLPGKHNIHSLTKKNKKKK